jgi:exopolysaccharide biosynthesis polyprenyl glycosylphosphotransferase
MSQLKNAPVAIANRRTRAVLRLVNEDAATRRFHSSRPPGPGLAWAHAYQSKLRLTDTLIIVVATFSALAVSLGSEGAEPSAAVLNAEHWTAAVSIALTWVIVMGSFHTRERRIVGAGAAEYRRVIAACSVTFGLLAIAFLMLNADFARQYFLVTLPLGIVALVGSRWLWRRWLTRQRRFGHYLSRVVVVGNRDDTEYVVDRVEARMGAAYTVVGVVLDGQHSDTAPITTGIRVHHGLDTVAETAADLQADAVIVAGQPSSGNDFIRHLAWQLEGTAAELILASRLTDIAGPRIHFRPMEGLPLIHVEIPQFEGGKHVIKRALDVIVSAIALLLLLPLFVALAVLIRADSPGPALFGQQRVGRNGRTFRMFKFRSMVVAAPELQNGLLALNEGTGVLFKMKNDPRVTRVGRVLRKYSLDELPQLWNVLLGDMSLVGPRPPLPHEVLRYEGKVHRRLYIKPGLTGMWQVNGRSDLNWEDSVRLDLYYVENWSLVGDLVIMWRTLNVLLHPVGAY